MKGGQCAVKGCNIWYRHRYAGHLRHAVSRCGKIFMDGLKVGEQPFCTFAGRQEGDGKNLVAVFFVSGLEGIGSTFGFFHVLFPFIIRHVDFFPEREKEYPLIVTVSVGCVFCPGRERLMD